MIASHTDEAPHYFYVPYSKDPQDGLKLVRLGKSNELRLSFSNMEYLSNQSDLRASPLSPSPLSKQPYGSIQSTQYFYQQLPEHQYLQSPTLDNYLSAQPQHYFREPQTQFSTSQVAGQETQSEYFYKKFQQQRLLCIYLQELSLKQQKEMLFLKKALNELQYITVRSLRGK